MKLIIYCFLIGSMGHCVFGSHSGTGFSPAKAVPEQQRIPEQQWVPEQQQQVPEQQQWVPEQQQRIPEQQQWLPGFDAVKLFFSMALTIGQKS